MIPFKRRYTWTAEMEAELRRDWRSGKLTDAIASNLGVSSDAVSTKAHAMQLCRHPVHTPRLDNLREPRRIWAPADFRFWAA